MNKPSRRAVVRTGVWAVPAVATAAAVPAFAGSGPVVTIAANGSVCKDPGDGQNTKDYEFTLYFTNSSSSDQLVSISNFNFKDRDNTPDPNSVTIPGGATNYAVTFKLTQFDDSSSNPVATITYSVAGVGDTASVTFSTPIHPC